MNSAPHQSGNADDPGEYLSIQQIQKRYGIGPETLLDWVLGSDMPEIHRYGLGRIGWKISELETWERHHQLWEKMGQAQKRFGKRKKNLGGKS